MNFSATKPPVLDGYHSGSLCSSVVWLQSWAKENKMPVFQMKKVVIMVKSVLSHLFLSDISSCIISPSSCIT